MEGATIGGHRPPGPPPNPFESAKVEGEEELVEWGCFYPQIKTKHSHHQLRHLLEISSVSPNKIHHIADTNQAVTATLSTSEEPTNVPWSTDSGFPQASSAHAIVSGYGYLVAVMSYNILVVEEESTKLVHFARATSASSQLNFVTLANSSQGLRLYVAGNGGYLKSFKIPEMEEVQNIGIGGRNYNCVAVSPDGTRLICAMDSKIVTTMWTMDPQSGLWGSPKDITIFDWTYSSMGCAWDPTSRYFAIAGGEVAVYDTQENKVVAKYSSIQGESTNHGRGGYDDCRVVRFSPNPDVPLMVILEHKERIQFVDTRTWKVQKVTFNSSTTFNGASFSLDGLTLYIGTPQGLQEWHVKRENTLVELCLRLITRKLRTSSLEEQGWDLTILPLELREKILPAARTYQPAALPTDFVLTNLDGANRCSKRSVS